MKKIIMLVVLFALLIGGGLGIMAMLGQGPLASLLKKDEKPAEAPPPAPLPAAVYDLGSYTIPLIKAHNITRQVGMDLEVEVDGKVSDKVNNELPRLQNAYTIELFNLVPHHSDVHSAADKQAIRERLIIVGNKIYGEGMVHDVVIKSMYDR